ncbi:MAG TPA: ABC transporter substrate-binding protein, partial [Burkholderiaceae bacterium]|nr:ABC transporter substrate-binding protein [Burkholderiaceae bacterium]
MSLSHLPRFAKRGLAALLAVGALVAAAPASAQSNVLRVVPHSNLAVLDPIWTTAYMSRNHGYMIYDTLFGTDEKGQVKPQMVESYQI